MLDLFADSSLELKGILCEIKATCASEIAQMSHNFRSEHKDAMCIS